MSDLESSTAAASTAGPSTAAPSLSSKRSKGKSNGLLITTPLANSTTGSSPEDPRLQSIKSPLFKSISNFAVHINVRRPSEKAKLNDETLADMLDDHLNTAMKSKTLNKGTLTFDAKDVEQAYRVFFLHKNLISWQVFAGVNILLIILAEALLFSLSTDLLKVSPNEYAILNGAIVLAPTIIIMGLTLVLPKQFLEHWIHFFSVLFLLFVGPILSCGHYFIAEKSSYSLAISGTVYILEIFSCVYFLQIRFLYTVGGVILLAIPSWFLVFALALKSSSEARIGFIISTIASVLTLIIVSIMSYKQEKAMRYQFISDQQFLTINMKLHDQLSGLIKGYSNKIADLDSPLEKAIYGIKSLLASPSMSIEHLQTLQLILACLNSTNILTPDFDSQMRTGGIDVTDEQKVLSFSFQIQ